MSKLAQSVDMAYKKAEELNLDVVVPDEYTLQLDYDSKTLPENFNKLCALIDINFGIKRSGDQEVYDMDIKTSKSGNLHVYLKLANPISNTERLVFQAALGSDPVREILSLARLKRGETTPTLLFEVKKPENTPTVSVQTGFERV